VKRGQQSSRFPLISVFPQQGTISRATLGKNTKALPVALNEILSITVTESRGSIPSFDICTVYMTV
jgi:hypothetical protein